MRDARIAGVIVNTEDAEYVLRTNLTLMELYEAVRDHALGDWTSMVITLVPVERSANDHISTQ